MKKQQGFTLIELLVVIAIIGLLSTLAVVALGNARVEARDAKRQSDLKVFQTAIELYSTENDAAPHITANATDINTWNELETALAVELPGGLPEDPGSRSWIYCDDSSGGNYMVGTSLEQNTTVAGDIDGQNADIDYDGPTECVGYDFNTPAALDRGDVVDPDCRDSNLGTIGENATATAVCLGQNGAA